MIFDAKLCFAVLASFRSAILWKIQAHNNLVISPARVKQIFSNCNLYLISASMSNIGGSLSEYKIGKALQLESLCFKSLTAAYKCCRRSMEI